MTIVANVIFMSQMAPSRVWQVTLKYPFPIACDNIYLKLIPLCGFAVTDEKLHFLYGIMALRLFSFSIFVWPAYTKCNAHNART